MVGLGCLLFLNVALSFGQRPLNFGELKAAYESGNKNVAADYDSSLTAAAESYEKDMNYLATELQKLGDLRAVVWIKEELTRFGAIGDIPVSALAVEAAPMRTLQLRYIEARKNMASLKAKKTTALAYTYLGNLDKLVRKYTQLQQAEWAGKITAEIERVKSSTDFNAAMAVINRNAQQDKPKAEAKVVRGNVALSVKGSFAIAESGAFSMIDGQTRKENPSAGFARVRFPGEFVISLPEIYLLKKIRIKFMDWNGELYQYALSTSTDAEKWQPLADRSSGSWTGWQEHIFAGRAVQDIRIEGLYSSGSPHVGIVEVEAYCE